MFKIIFVLIGTFVGAGFASGKEVFNFFTYYSYYGIISIFIFSLLLFLLIFKCLNIKTNLKLNSYNEFIFYLENFDIQMSFILLLFVEIVNARSVPPPQLLCTFNNSQRVM